MGANLEEEMQNQRPLFGSEHTACRKTGETRSTNLGVDVLLELQLLLQGLQAVLCIHPPQHLVLQLLLCIGKAAVQLGEKTEKRLKPQRQQKNSGQEGAVPRFGQ